MTITAVDPKNNCITVIRKIKQDEIQEKMAVAVPVNLNISELEQLIQDGLYLVIFPENLTAQEQQNLIEQQKKSNMITALAVRKWRRSCFSFGRDSWSSCRSTRYSDRSSSRSSYGKFRCSCNQVVYLNSDTKN